MELVEHRNKELAEFRGREVERNRIADLMGLLPADLTSILDIGARDGFISKLLADRIRNVTALDLEMPEIDDERIHCVKGDLTRLDFPDDSFDIILCAEVLEHIPTRLLGAACGEMRRVAKKYLLIGVPYQQDLREARTTCYTCGERNPPWGHVNSFDEDRLKELFPMFEVARISLLGDTQTGTNFVSSFLMDKAGNPYGTYWQEEPCVHCGSALISPPERSLWQKGLTKTALYVDAVQRLIISGRPNWIHILLKKKTAEQAATTEANLAAPVWDQG
jgi:SAM-dependent methyltransferase